MEPESLIDTQAFFPKELTVNAGDAILFEFPDPPGFHTVTFLSGEEVPPLIIPDEDAATPAASPAAGPPPLIINPQAAFPSGGNTYDGTGYLNSGLDAIRLPGDPPFMVTFTTPGSYEYQCIPHGVVMKATVVVQEAGSAVPEDQAAADARGEQERTALIKEGEAEIAEYAEATPTTRDDGSTLWEVAAGAGEGQARVLAFLPDTLEIKAGDTVRWVNHSKTEPHTVTFLGAGAEQPEDVIIEPQPSGPPKLVQSPLTLFPQGSQVFNGQGYANSGFLGELNGQPLPGGPAYELTFDTAGEYRYYCVLHASGPEGPGMVGTIMVT
jgi:plastocyanin